MSSGGRKSEDDRAASSLSRNDSSGAGGGGGLLGFLKTELDSFMRGLSGKPDTCLPKLPSHDAATKPPQKRQKRSHEDETSAPTYAELKAFERELDAIRVKTTKRYTNQDFYAPLTEENLRASTSQLQMMHWDIDVAQPTKSDRRSQETRKAVEAYSSYYTDETMPSISSAHSQGDQSSNTQPAEQRRKKRERAATFVNDADARQAVARQFAEEETRLRAAEERARQHKARREREARDSKRRQDRAQALARLEAREQQERVQTAKAAHSDHAAQLEPSAAGKTSVSCEDQQVLSVQPASASFDSQAHTTSATAHDQLTRSRDVVWRSKTSSNASKHTGTHDRLGEAYQTRSENARETVRNLEKAEVARTQAKESGRESKRIRELEAEVERLRTELEDAKRKQETSLNLSTSRHVHFVPTPPASESLGAEQSFISISSESSAHPHSVSLAQRPLSLTAPPPPPPTAPPPPPVMQRNQKPSALSLVAARRASNKSPGSLALKKKPSLVGMPADMGKFLSEMRQAKLKKVGLPADGQKKRRADDEVGLKSMLEGVLKKRFAGEKDRASSSTAASKGQTSSNTSRLSDSSITSLTSFSSYRPPDWSMDMMESPFPPPRSTSLPRGASEDLQPSSIVVHHEKPQCVAPSAPGTVAAPVYSKSPREGPKLSRTQSYSAVRSQDQQTPSFARGHTRSHSAGRVQIRPQAAFGHAITNEEPAEAGRQRAQPYVGAPGHAAVSGTPGRRSNEFLRHRKDSLGLPEPSTIATERTRTRQSSDNTATGRSVRSAGSSFDIDIYTQMQLQQDEEMLEEEMRLSYTKPLQLDGAMDFDDVPAMRLLPVSPKAPAAALHAYQIPDLNLRQSGLHFSPAVALPTFRPQLGERKVSAYTHPRAAPAPPSATDNLKSHDSPIPPGASLSPSKTRAKAKVGRRPLRVLPSQQQMDDILFNGVSLSEVRAEQLLAEDQNQTVYTGLGLGRA